MTNDLTTLREAIYTAQKDQAESLEQLSEHALATHDEGLIELVSRIQGNDHELTLLRKRELHLITHGRELEEAANIPESP